MLSPMLSPLAGSLASSTLLVNAADCGMEGEAAEGPDMTGWTLLSGTSDEEV